MGTGRAEAAKRCGLSLLQAKILQSLEEGREKGIRFLKGLSSCKFLHMNRGCGYKATNPRAPRRLPTPKGRRKLGGGGGRRGCVVVRELIKVVLKW